MGFKVTSKFKVKLFGDINFNVYTYKYLKNLINLWRKFLNQLKTMKIYILSVT